MSSRDALGDFPTTQSTWLITRIDDGGADALREARVHLMERYRTALVAYAANSRLATIDEPDELVHGFFAAKAGDPKFLRDWRASGLALRRWMLNGLVFYARGVVRDRARHAARLDDARPEHVDDPSPRAQQAFDRAWSLALVEAACRAAHTALAAEGRERAYDCFHRQVFEGLGYARLAADHGCNETTVASEIRLATRRVRAEAESMLRDELGTADPGVIADELARVRALTGWPA